MKDNLNIRSHSDISKTKFIYSYKTDNWTPLELIDKLNYFKDKITENAHVIDNSKKDEVHKNLHVKGKIQYQRVPIPPTNHFDQPLSKYKEDLMRNFETINFHNNEEDAKLETMNKIFDNFIQSKKKTLPPLKGLDKLSVSITDSNLSSNKKKFSNNSNPRNKNSIRTYNYKRGFSKFKVSK